MRGSERERESVRERRTTYQSIDIGHTPHDGGAKHVERRGASSGSDRGVVGREAWKERSRRRRGDRDETHVGVRKRDANGPTVPHVRATCTSDATVLAKIEETRNERRKKGR